MQALLRCMCACSCILRLLVDWSSRLRYPIVAREFARQVRLQAVCACITISLSAWENLET